MNINSSTRFYQCSSRFQYATTTRLVLRERDDDDSIENLKDEDKSFWRNWLETRQIEDPRLLVGDVFSIVIASQLMGLLDALNNPEFARNGGWFQPIPELPSTLGILVERISTLSLVWILAALSEEDSFSSVSVENEKVSILMALTIVVDFVALRLLLGCTLGFTSHTDISFGPLLRDCYLVALMLPGFRFLYSQYNLR
jgi:hypothetical protein